VGVDEGAGARLAARSCEPLAPPEPEPEPEPDPAAPKRPPVGAPRELEERFGPGGRESVEAQGLEVWLSSACFLL